MISAHCTISQISYLFLIPAVPPFLTVRLAFHKLQTIICGFWNTHIRFIIDNILGCIYLNNDSCSLVEQNIGKLSGKIAYHVLSLPLEPAVHHCLTVRLAFLKLQTIFCNFYDTHIDSSFHQFPIRSFLEGRFCSLHRRQILALFWTSAVPKLLTERLAV